MKREPTIPCLAVLALAALLPAAFSGCVTMPTATNERLSETSIASATVNKKPGAKKRAHRYMTRRAARFTSPGKRH